MLDYLVPILLLGGSLAALRKRENGYAIMLQGASEGLQLLVSLVPTLVILLTAVTVLRASGAMSLLGQLLAPALSLFGIPKECAMLILVRPISGSAALAVGSELMAQYGVNSTIGRTAAIMLGSTETTFYTMSIYFGACGIQKTRYALPTALFADFVGFFAASWTARWI